MVMSGARSARWTISTPMRWSMLAHFSSAGSSWVEAYNSARPPPGTTPSSTAARVAFKASTTRSFFSPTSTSDAPPTLINAMPPESFASRSWSFSFSYSDDDAATRSRMSSHRSSTSSREPAPSKMMVSSFDTVAFLQLPRCASVAFSSLRPTSSEMTVPPVSAARSWSVSFRLSPKPGALTAQIRTPARSLLTTSVASASDSTSSATMSSARCDLTTVSSNGTMDAIVETFFSTRRMYGSSTSNV
mmetsp:Transcript_27391/g.84509  ORF Transcript_27391/g.84509 Transcript_27391/m.84509 type:complete len:246 (-) Transcript_27391:1090-1827(-)